MGAERGPPRSPARCRRATTPAAHPAVEQIPYAPCFTHSSRARALLLQPSEEQVPFVLSCFAHNSLILRALVVHARSEQSTRASAAAIAADCARDNVSSDAAGAAFTCASTAADAKRCWRAAAFPVGTYLRVRSSPAPGGDSVPCSCGSK